jgi:hypothetical protein
MRGETKSVLPVITDKYKNADMGKDIKDFPIINTSVTEEGAPG